MPNEQLNPVQSALWSDAFICSVSLFETVLKKGKGSWRD